MVKSDEGNLKKLKEKVEKVTARLSESRQAVNNKIRSVCRRNPPAVDDALALSTLEGVGVRVRDEFGTRKVDLCSNNCNNVDIDTEQNNANKDTVDNKGDGKLTTDTKKKKGGKKKDQNARTVDKGEEASSNIEEEEEYQRLKRLFEDQKWFVRKAYLWFTLLLLYCGVWVVVFAASLPKKTRHSENPPWFWIAHFLYYIVFVIMKVPQLVDFLKDGTKISNATWGCLATIISVVTGMATGHNSTVNIVFALIICSLVLMTDILMAHMLPVDFTRRSISKAVIVLAVLLFVGSITWLPIDTASNDRNDPIIAALVVSSFALIIFTLEQLTVAQLIQGTRQQKAREKELAYQTLNLLLLSTWIFQSLVIIVSEIDGLRPVDETSSPVEIIPINNTTPKNRI